MGKIRRMSVNKKNKHFLKGFEIAFYFKYKVISTYNQNIEVIWLVDWIANSLLNVSVNWEQFTYGDVTI